MAYGSVAYGAGGYGAAAAEAVATLGEPEVDVLVDFVSTSPGTETPVFTSLGHDLRAFEFFRGRQRELNTFQPGRGSFRLSNHDRRYDPNYTTGPYYPNVKPMRRTRTAVTYNGVTFYLIEGFIDGWDREYHGPHDASTVVTYTDGFKVLTKAGLPTSAWVSEIQRDAPVAWWRLDEPVGATVLRDIIGGRELTVNGSPTLNVTGLVTRDPNTAVILPLSTDGGSMRQGVPTGGPLSAEIIYSGDCTDGVLMGQQNTGPAANGWVLLVSGGKARVTVDADVDGLGNASVVSTGGVDNLAPHHIVAVWETTGLLRIYVDGVDATTNLDDPLPNFNFSAGQTFFIGGGELGGLPVAGAFGTLDEAIVYDYALSAEQVANHYEAYRLGGQWDGDSSGERLERILDIVDWPESRREIDQGLSTLQSTSLGGTAMAYAQKIEASEFGSLFMSKLGAVRLVARDAQWNREPVATVTDTDHYADSNPDYNDELIRNEAIISREGGVPQIVRDEDSIEEFLLASYTSDGLLHDSDATSLDAANYVVTVYKDAQQRISGLTFNPRKDPGTLFPLLLALELGDWLVVEETPQGIAPTDSQAVVIEGIGIRWSPKNWEITLNCSPAEILGEFWELDIDGHSELDETTRLSF